jgi:hypothetical protein
MGARAGTGSAIAYWKSAGMDTHALTNLQWRITNLPENVLGLTNTQQGIVWIDQNAAGHGWFLDSTPKSDLTFFRPISPEELQALVDHVTRAYLDEIVNKENHQKRARLDTLTSGEAERLIDSGVIAGGMVPKIRAALAALAWEGSEAIIADASADGALERALSDPTFGTRITAGRSAVGAA